MKCFAVLFVSWLIGEGYGQQFESLSAMSIIAPQIEFLEDKCFNRTNDATVFGDLQQTMEDCQSIILNGTQLSLTYETLANSDASKFYEFYSSWVINFQFIFKLISIESIVQAVQWIGWNSIPKRMQQQAKASAETVSQRDGIISVW